MSKEPDHNKYDKEVVQIIQWKAHKDSIRFIKFINETDFPIIFTAGMDKMARIWNIKGEPMGTLRQGVVKFPDKAWEFPLGGHEELKEDRNSKVEAMLQEVKVKRDMDVQSRKMFTKGVDKKKTITARAMDKTTQPIVSPLSKTFHKDADYSTVTTKFYGDEAEVEQNKGEDHTSKAKRLLETIKKMSYAAAKANDRDTLDEEIEKMNKRKIGPFQFDIDNEIDTEILKNDEVYKDLKELDENIIKTNKMHSSLVTKSFGRRKKRK